MQNAKLPAQVHVNTFSRTSSRSVFRTS